MCISGIWVVNLRNAAGQQILPVFGQPKILAEIHLVGREPV